MCDLNDFKPVNDTFGHGAGDLVLSTIGQRLESACRADELAIRWGGDEFLVVAAGVVDDAALTDRIEPLSRAIEQPIDCDGEMIQVSMSVGAVLIDELGRAVSQAGAIDELLGRADRAMYVEKRRSQRRVVDREERRRDRADAER